MAGRPALRPPRPRPGRSRRIAAWVVMLMGVAVTVMCLTLFIAMRMDDSAIDGHLATATATVISVSALHTGIEFVAANGQTIRPPGGVLYPGLLSLGQHFLVEYSTTNPTTVRVAGRTAGVGNLQLAATAVTTWVLTASLCWWLRTPRRPKPAGPGPSAAEPELPAAPGPGPGPVSAAG